MSVLLFGVGALAALVGAALVGFGIPINEFSFGNTLIVAGTTVFTGGLIVAGLGVVVMHLQRLADVLAQRSPVRPSRPLDVFDTAAGSRGAPGRMPFPPKPKFDERGEPAESSSPAEQGHSFAPTLRNPDEAPVTVEDDISLSPHHPAPAPVVGSGEHSPSFGFNDETDIPKTRQSPIADDGWRPAAPQAAPARQPNTAYFDAMWPAEPKAAKSGPSEADVRPYEPRHDRLPREAAPVMHTEPEAPMPRRGNEPRTVAILKSGVVDGMGYTLYVDGSIEAELPQGTLRFASINDLRSHLEKNT